MIQFDFAHLGNLPVQAGGGGLALKSILPF